MISNAQAKLDYLFGTKAAIKLAIETKGVTIGEAITFRQYADKIGEIPTGGGGDYLVRFIDYDGTILKEQTVNSGQAATAPALPTHDNLTFQAWNNTFTNVTSDIDIGATYITTDGKTHLYITLTVPTGLSPVLRLQKYTADVMTINWGDGTSGTTTTNGNIAITHTYPFTDDYDITVECVGTYAIGDSTTAHIFDNYDHILTKTFLGINVTAILEDSFSNCTSLQKIVIPLGVTTIESWAFNLATTLFNIIIPTGVTSIGAYTFAYCYSIKNIVLPDGIISIGTESFSYCHTLQGMTFTNSISSMAGSIFTQCYSIKNIILPADLTRIERNVFESCYSLENVVLPAGVTFMDYGVFSACKSLKSIIIPVGVTSMGNSMFNDCNALQNVVLPTGLLSIGNSAFAFCYSLHNLEIPDGCIVGTDFFEFCKALTSIVIPEGQTEIGNDFAYYAWSLKTVSLPSTILSIADDAFSDCEQLLTFEILATTPPTLHAGAFDSYSKILKIYVPDASVDAYKAATNWITLADYIHPISTRP